MKKSKLYENNPHKNQPGLEEANMNRREMQKPLVQTALVLLGVILLIGFVAGSDAQSFFGGVGSIVKGVFLSILYAIALAISLVVSVVFLFAIFLGAVALYSQETAKDLYNKLLQSVMHLYSTWFPPKAGAPLKEDVKEDVEKHAPLVKEKTETAASPAIEKSAPEPTPALLAGLREEISQEINKLNNSVNVLDERNKSFDRSIAGLKQSLEANPSEDIINKISSLEAQHQDLSSQLSTFTEKLAQMGSVADEAVKLAKQQSFELSKVETQISSYSSAIDDLQQKLESKTAEPVTGSENHRIFNYLEKDADKKKFAKLIGEAIAKEMTYTEIDTFLTKSLSKDADTIIKEHPSLTKQYIRDCKNT